MLGVAGAGAQEGVAGGEWVLSVATNLVAPAGQARVPLGQDALHPQEEGPLDLVLWEGEKSRGGVSRGLHRACAVHSASAQVTRGRRALYFTLHEVRVIRLVGCEHGRHLIVVGGVDVLVNAIAGQLYLREMRRRRRGRKGFSAGIAHSPHTHLHCQPGGGGGAGEQAQ